jgi:uncharacterized membrane protein
MAKRIEERIAASEKRHSGEIKVVIEGGLPLHYLWQGISSRQRAQRLFGELGIWDTEERNGVLIYLLLADHAIEIVADRGLSKRIEAETWFAMVERLGQTLSMKDPETGLTEALAEISALQMQHFEKSVNQRDFDELCNLVLYL